MPPKDWDLSRSPADAGIILQESRKCPDVIQPYVVGPDPNPAYPGNVIVRFRGPESVNRDPSLRIQFGPAVDSLDDLTPTGDDVLLTDVISFEVRPAWIYNPVFNQLLANSSPVPEDMSQGNSDEPFADLPPSGINPTYKDASGKSFGAFDTWYDPAAVFGTEVNWNDPNPQGTDGFLYVNPANPITGATKPPHRINVRALQIKVRVWDPKAEQARQATIINEG